MSWVAPAVERADEPVVGDERAMLAGFLDSARAGLLLRCAGLTGEQLARRTVPPSNLSLLGLVRHISDVERTWFRRRFAGEGLESRYGGSAFDDVDAARPRRTSAGCSRNRTPPGARSRAHRSTRRSTASAGVRCPCGGSSST